MVRVAFTPNLQRHLDCPDVAVTGSSLREILNAAFEQNPRMRGYILDDQDAVRKHVAIFIDNQPVVDRVHLSDRIDDDSEVFVMQALSGG